MKKWGKLLAAKNKSHKSDISDSSSNDDTSSSAVVNNGREKSFPVVGMGSSAGGLDALKEFFDNMPSDSDMAFIIVSHLEPNHASFMSELIQVCTDMPVSQIENGTVVEPNHVYIIPPKKEVKLTDRTLYLFPQITTNPIRMVIDNFFRSLAHDQNGNAVAIIFSGAGSDGSVGISEIRNNEGMVMVQSPETAKFDSMPTHAIATSMVDFVLPPCKMPEQLIKYCLSVGNRAQPSFLNNVINLEDILNAIFFVLRNQLGHDFSGYKRSTICRRIERRMNVLLLNDISCYLRFLQENPEEVTALFRELLIGVTSFFRDPQAFDILKTKVLPDIVKSKPNDSCIRVWIPGCSTGEEAYSIAILLHECIAGLGNYCSVQIFATDVNEQAIEHGRAGIFPDSISTDVNDERLNRFFTHENGVYRVKNEIRSMLTFAVQNLIMDPPFTKIDLICCRNLLIYMQPETQKKIMSIFYYSLLPKGVLFLGCSESTGDIASQFSPVDQKYKIFVRTGFSFNSTGFLDFSLSGRGIVRHQVIPSNEPKAGDGMFKQVERCLLGKYAPPCVVINQRNEIVYIIHSGMGRYLDLAYGDAHLNIVQMAKRDIRNQLAALIRKATNTKTRVCCSDLKVKSEGGTHRFNMFVEPLLEQDTPADLLLVIFEETPEHHKRDIVPPLTSGKASSREKQLEAELAAVKEDLKFTIEAMEVSNEELQSTNEELQSTNEELQSTNEELETSKEELQSLNEELATVNAENDSRILELSHAVDDIRNLLDNTPYPTVFLDCQLRVKRFTQKATLVINLIDADIDRPVAHIVTKLKYDHLVDDANQVLKTLVPVDKEVQGTDGKWYTLRMTPYRTISNVIDGIVVTFDDITERKQLEDSQRLATVIRNSADAITMIDLAGNIKAWNRGAELLYGWQEDEALTMNILDMVPKAQKKRMSTLLKKLSKNNLIDPVKIIKITKDGRMINVWFIVSRLMDESGEPLELLTTTERLAKG